MSIVEAARSRVLAGADITAAVRESLCGAGHSWQVLSEVLAELHGAGAQIQPLLEDPAVTDVLINDDDEVWVDSGTGLRRLPTVLDARSLALRLATLAGKRLDNAAPIVDGRLPDGTRLHAVLPPLARGSACISLRSPARHRYGWQELLANGFLSPPLAQVLDQLIRTRANVLVSGGAGTGKTTLVAAVLGKVPWNERVLIIEEATELLPRHPHTVHLQSRSANVQGAGHVGLAELLRAAMRMRPDRLVLGECRGEEVREMLAGFNTGHDGGWATIHANTAIDVPARLTALGALAHMSPATVHVQAQAALDAVVHLSRVRSQRVVNQIGIVAKTGEFRVEPALSRDPTDPGEVVLGPGWAELAHRLDQER